MGAMMRWAAVLAAALVIAAGASAEVPVEERIVETEEGGTMLAHAIVVDAPAEDAWAAISTSEGWMSWAVPFAVVDFRIGGTIETSYDPEAEAGDPANIVHRIQAFLPGRMLAMRVEQVPPGFPFADAMGELFSVTEIEDLGDGSTRITVTGVGYDLAREDHQQMIAFFRQGNPMTLRALAQMLESGAQASAEAAPEDSDAP